MQSDSNRESPRIRRPNKEGWVRRVVSEHMGCPMQVYVSQRAVEFACSRCGFTWVEEYEVRHVEDSEGGIWEHFRIDGSPTTSPLARCVCKQCHQPTVSIVPTAHSRVGTEHLSQGPPLTGPPFGNP